ncbi:MAG: hypothetical protein II897_00205 [Clostridia bacterium]|nr:hypothetical protein [Clostridia bacterium]
MNEAKRGVFWLIDGKLYCFPFDKSAEHGVAKSGNTYNHKLLWEHVRPKGCNKPFTFYPRGRVEIDAHGCPVVFMSPHIDAAYIPEIMAPFSLLDEPRVIIDGSRHYSSHIDHETMQKK